MDREVQEPSSYKIFPAKRTQSTGGTLSATEYERWQKLSM